MLTKALVITGDGLNCERETAFAFSQVGFETEILHVNQLLKVPKRIHEFGVFAIPGGFSFGDEIKSGQVLALKLKKSLLPELEIFLENKKLVLGICNGFQTLVQLGLLNTGLNSSKLSSGSRPRSKDLSLEVNNHKKFIDQWVTLMPNPKSNCVWTKDLETSFQTPIRHKEGRLTFKPSISQDKIESWSRSPRVALTYSENVNGSTAQIAGITCENGQILGLMPHPEAALKISSARKIFQNAYEYTSTLS